MDDDAYDLTILYTEDTVQWCEYLFDVFKDFDVRQNAEDITEFPTNPCTLKNIKDSVIVVVIISPRFLQKCTPRLQDYVNVVVGVICGVDDADMEEVQQKIPAAADWTFVEAAAGGSELGKVVLKVMHNAVHQHELQRQQADTEDTYLTITDNVEFVPSDYIEMGNVELRSTYFSPGGSSGSGQIGPGPGSAGVPEEVYEPMKGLTAHPPPTATGHVFQKTNLEYVNMNRAKLAPQCSAGLTIYPTEARSGDAGDLYLFFQDSVVNDKGQYQVHFKGQLKESKVTAAYKSPYTLRVELPTDHPAELVDVQVTSQGQSVMGTFKFLFTSICSDLAELLQKAVDPVSFMCESLGISPADYNELDNKLYAHVKHRMPSTGLGLQVDQSGPDQGGSTEVPTALHFAAKFGLKNICSVLVNSPGAVNAMKIKNSKNMTPDMLADKHGHSDLKNFLENFLEIATDDSQAPESGAATRYVHMEGGKFYYNQSELIKKLHAEQVPNYDSPFNVPIPAHGIPIKEETIKKLVQGQKEDIEEYYGSFPLDMGSFERDNDSEEEYDLVDESYRPARPAVSKLSSDRPPARPPGSDKPALGPPEVPAPRVESRQAPATEPKTEATPAMRSPQSKSPGATKPFAAGQEHLIEIQNRVKKGDVSLDDAVLLFKKWEHFQASNRLSFSTQAENFKTLKQQKQKGLSGLFSKKTNKKGQQQTPAPGFLKSQERLQTEISQQNRPTSTTSLDSHGSRDSSYNSAPDEPDQERYYPSSQMPSIGPPVARRPDPPIQQERIKRLSQAYDQLPNLTPQKPAPPMPNRAAAPLPPAIKNLPKPMPPFGQHKVPQAAPKEEEQPVYLEFDDQTPDDLPELPPPPPPTASERSPEIMSTIQIPRQEERFNPNPTKPTPPSGKRPVPRPRNPPK